MKIAARKTSRASDQRDDAETGSEPFRLEITDILDLHTFRPGEIADALTTYLEEARQRGFATVRIIHGKGIGVQRERVRAVLGRTPFVLQFQDAPMEAGGWGATIAWLKLPSQPEDMQ